MINRAALFLVGLILALSLFARAGHAASLEIGQPAPDFTLMDPNGQQHRLSDYRNSIVVLEWTNPQCPYVRKHYASGAMQKLQNEELRYSGLAWLRIDSSGPGKEGYLDAAGARALIGSDGSAQTAFLLDPDGAVGKLYGAKATPHMFVIDKNGLLQYRGAIDDAPSTDPATLVNAKNYVSLALNDIRQNRPVGLPVTEAYGCSVKYAN